jgi:hypothetical protein
MKTNRNKENSVDFCGFSLYLTGGDAGASPQHTGLTDGESNGLFLPVFFCV